MSVLISPIVVDHVLEKVSRMRKNLKVFLRVVNLVFDVKGARQPCLTSHHDSTRYGFCISGIIWNPTDSIHTSGARTIKDCSFWA